MDSSRFQRLRAFMEQQNLQAVLLTSPKHVYYFTGFYTNPHERFLGLLVPHHGEPVLIVPALDEEAARQTSSIQQIVSHTDTQNPYLLLRSVMPAAVNRLGVEKDHLSVTRFEEIIDQRIASEYVNVEEVLRAMRLIKSQDEVARIRKAIDLVEDVLREGLQKVAVGVREIELAAELEYLMKKRGADGPSFETTVLFGERSALPHGIPGERRVASGELLLIDMGVAVDGYVSDITRTFVVGEASEQQKEIYEAVLAANQAAISAVRPGERLASLDLTARRLIAERGFGDFFMHRLGHGMGMDVHEYPSIHAESEGTLQPGMVFTIEPGIYLPHLGGVRIEDDVLVTDDGVEVLTRFPKELTVLG
ncbi:Xaa-Pro peptidase family protein [Brevibacillus humidisoli]|uniref:M24 family metallopeptidase n=1 Tax=Brevibacillus humidisoli TaxID=2895522 RepID=UPI001E5FBDF4|nr:Xaa-Pro peptidase family protein [Brevibacillus humidisoli]UFJ38865.1 Xaa-Pro peptidase family protein [Brevibacillus humidisoli]